MAMRGRRGERVELWSFVLYYDINKDEGAGRVLV